MFTRFCYTKAISITSNYAKTNNEKLFGLKIHEHLLAGILKKKYTKNSAEAVQKAVISAK